MGLLNTCHRSALLVPVFCDNIRPQLVMRMVKILYLEKLFGGVGNKEFEVEFTFGSEAWSTNYSAGCSLSTLLSSGRS